MTNTSNLYRKCRSLVAKTVASGCTPAEHVSATNLAATMVAKHGLDASRIDWPAPPAGHAWSGEAGRSVVVELPADGPKAVAPKPVRKSKAEKPATVAMANKPKRLTIGDRLLAMLRQPNGLSIDEVMAEFKVLRHTARAYISVETRKAGVTYKRDRATGRYTVAA